MSEPRGLLNQRAVVAEARARKLEMEVQDLRARLEGSGVSLPPSSNADSGRLAQLERDLADSRRELTESRRELADNKRELAEGKNQQEELRKQVEQARRDQEAPAPLIRAPEIELPPVDPQAPDSERVRTLEEQLQTLQSRHASERREAEKLAYMDQLTGLPNLNLLRQALELTLKGVRAKEQTAALLLIDLDRFQPINRIVGYAQGNDLLRQVGERLRQLMPHGGVLGRQGEDEFVLIISVPADKSDGPTPMPNAAVLARNLAQQVQTTLSAPFMVQGQPICLAVTVGISTAPGDSDTPEEILEHADRALHQAKESGRGRFLFFTQEMAQETDRKTSLEQELRQALEQGEFKLQYNPVVELPRGLMVGALASLLWAHPQRGPQVPEEFLPVAEHSGLILPLGNWALAEVAQQVQRLKAGFVGLKLSTRQLLDPNLGNTVMTVLRDAQIKPDSLLLTVSESTLGDVPERFDAVMTQATNWGTPFALSQTGTDFLSLRRLQAAPVRFLRIARWIVDGVMHDENCATLCRTLLAMARQLGLTSLAEGADTAAQVRFLAAYRCDMACGAYFSVPASGEELLELRRRTWKM